MEKPELDKEVNDLIAHWDDDERSRDVHMERYWKKQIAEAALTRLRNGERGAELFRGVRADLGSPDVGISPAIFFLIVKVLVLLAELWFRRQGNEPRSSVTQSEPDIAAAELRG